MLPGNLSLWTLRVRRLEVLRFVGPSLCWFGSVRTTDIPSMPSHINNTHCLLLLSSAYRRVVGAACATPRPRRIPYHDVPLRRTTRPPSRAAVAAEVVVRSAAPDADADDARKQYQHRRPSDAARSSKRKKQEQKQKQDAGLPGATQRDARARQGKARRSDRGWMSGE